jgi:hypothetical protein
VQIYRSSSRLVVLNIGLDYLGLLPEFLKTLYRELLLGLLSTLVNVTVYKEFRFCRRTTRRRVVDIIEIIF